MTHDKIDMSNYREVAKAAVVKYFDKGMMADALLWQLIVGNYEKELTKYQKQNDNCIETIRKINSPIY